MTVFKFELCVIVKPSMILNPNTIYFQENLLQILSKNGKFSQFRSLLEV